jgi:hypothetical protein
MSTDVANGTVGSSFEQLACARLGLRDVSHHGHPFSYTDATVQEPTTVRTPDGPLDLGPGASVGIKVCRFRIAGGSRRGRYYLPWEEFTTVDALVLGVYSLTEGVLPGAFAVWTPAQLDDALDLTWHDDGHPQFSEVARFPWSRVIDPAEVELEGSG